VIPHSTSTIKGRIKREISYQDFALEFKLFMTEEQRKHKKGDSTELCR